MSESKKLRKRTLYATKNEVNHLEQEFKEIRETVVALLAERNLRRNNSGGNVRTTEEGDSSSSSFYRQQSAAHIDVSLAEIGNCNHEISLGDVKNLHKEERSSNYEVVDISLGKKRFLLQSGYKITEASFY